MVGIITGLRQAGAGAVCIHSMTNKAHLFRVLKLVLFMALVVGVFWHGLISPTARDAALLGVGYALVLTVGYDLVKRGLDLDRVVLIVGGLATVLAATSVPLGSLMLKSSTLPGLSRSVCNTCGITL